MATEPVRLGLCGAGSLSEIAVVDRLDDRHIPVCEVGASDGAKGCNVGPLDRQRPEAIPAFARPQAAIDFPQVKTCGRARQSVNLGGQFGRPLRRPGAGQKRLEVVAIGAAVLFAGQAKLGLREGDQPVAEGRVKFRSSAMNSSNWT